MSDVLVVPAKFARDTALRYGIYCCQNRRSFRSTDYLAFYYDNRIDLCARIVSVKHDVLVSSLSGFDQYLSERTARGVKNDVLNSVRWLEDLREIGPVVNDFQDDGGKRLAWCRKQRYTTLERLRVARLTSEL